MAKIKTSKTSKDVVIKKTGHPGSIYKVTCPKCRTAYAIRYLNKTSYECLRCHRTFGTSQM